MFSSPRCGTLGSTTQSGKTTSLPWPQAFFVVSKSVIHTRAARSRGDKAILLKYDESSGVDGPTVDETVTNKTVMQPKYVPKNNLNVGGYEAARPTKTIDDVHVAAIALHLVIRALDGADHRGVVQLI